MAVVTVQLEVEEAHEMVDGEMGLVLDYFVRGAHYSDAFWLAMRRHMLDMDARSFRVGFDEFMTQVRHVWWRDEPHYDEDTGQPDGSWWYVDCPPDTPGAYPVTVIDRIAVEHFLSDETLQDEVG